MIRTVATVAALTLVAGLSHAGQERSEPKKADVVKQLQQDFDEARARLQKDGPGEKTRAVHRRIIEGLDKLLEQEDDKANPPASSNANPPQESSAKQDEQPKGSQRPMPGVKPTPSSSAQPNSDGPSAPEIRPVPKGENGEPSKVGPDSPWDPRRKRQQQAVDALGRERFPPRYEELLRAYYRSLAAGRGEEP
jgi:hypothetical protein